jgi:predicted ribosome quality control (RQC) complex YloA/Tae2 family protein
MENFALISVAESLRPAAGEVIIRRVVQHQPNGFILHTRSSKFPALKILMNAQNPAFYTSEAKPPMDSPNTDFLMILRKHFTSAELVDFRKPMSERAFELVFKTAVPSKELETMSLVVELIPNAPNIILLDAQRRVVSSFSTITPQHGIGEFDPYALPAVSGKVLLERVAGEAGELEELADLPLDREAVMARVAGIGPVFADEIVFRCRQSRRSISSELREMLRQIQIPAGAWIYTEKPLGHILEQNDLKALGKAILSPMELLSLEKTHSSKVFGKITDATRFYFDELESRLLLDHAKLPLLRDLRTASKRLVSREKRLSRERNKYQDAERGQQRAQLLTSSGLNLEQRCEKVTVTDYFRDKPAPVEIELDPALTLRENIDKMFKLQQKAGRGKTMVASQLASVQKRIAMIEEQARKLQAIKDWDTWLAISERIEKERRSGGESDASQPESAGRRFRTFVVEDREILIGRSGKENDELTFRIATPDDFWFHVADYSGSHVIVRNPARERELPDTVLTKAAQLAAFFSQARNSSKVEVHYTRRKHVTKPRRAKPGLVRLLEFKSISVEPRNWLEDVR